MSFSPELKIGNMQCLRYWALLKDTENLDQAARAATDLDQLAGLYGTNRHSIEEWTSILEAALLEKNMI
tara:strand:+ start:584 stop:790 length:207 start_codon:yes stop_codon:yes gene_type:complete